jgi:hypothetical protein
MYGKDYAYAATRLNGTIVRDKDGEPFHVINVDVTGDAVGYLLKGGSINNTPVHRRVDDLNVQPVHLGYVNHEGGGVTYIRRMPLRRDWKQGLRSEQCVSSNIRLNGMDWKELRKTILGEFIPFKRAIKYNFGVAFHRHWAVNRKRLYYKNKQVGIIHEDNPVLNDEHQYLKEYLQECLK